MRGSQLQYSPAARSPQGGTAEPAVEAVGPPVDVILANEVGSLADHATVLFAAVVGLVVLAQRGLAVNVLSGARRDCEVASVRMFDAFSDRHPYRCLTPTTVMTS